MSVNGIRQRKVGKARLLKTYANTSLIRLVGVDQCPNFTTKGFTLLYTFIFVQPNATESQIRQDRT